jgi:hypothetical protein
MTPGADWPPDNAIVALFRQWVAAENEAEALGRRDAEDGTPERAEFEAASERTTDLRMQSRRLRRAAQSAWRSRSTCGTISRTAPGTTSHRRPSANSKPTAPKPRSSYRLSKTRCASCPSSRRSPRLLSNPAKKKPPDRTTGCASDRYFSTTPKSCLISTPVIAANCSTRWYGKSVRLSYF